MQEPAQFIVYWPDGSQLEGKAGRIDILRNELTGEILKLLVGIAPAEKKEEENTLATETPHLTAKTGQEP
jgi:hypothetical protein